MTEPPPNRSVQWMPVFWGALIFSVLLAVGGMMVFRFHLYLSWLGAASVSTALLFGIDKVAAKFNWRRIPERSLLLMVLVGGWGGGWIGQFLFRHKRRKWVFWLVLAVATLLHATAVWFIWQHTGF